MTTENNSDLRSLIRHEIELELMLQQEKPITIEKAAEHLDISTAHLRRLISTDKLPKKYVHRFGGGYRFFKSELNEYIKSTFKISKS